VAPAQTTDRPARLAIRQVKIALWTIWALAAICAGIGIGRLIVAARTPLENAVFPAPVAVASITVDAVKTATITLAQPAVLPVNLTVNSAAAVPQAQSGTPISTLSVARLQSSAGGDALQPGFSRLTRIQGNLGTAAVR
jgi:hypothetical protein